MLSQTTYEALPYSYIGVGLATSALMDSRLALIPSAVLVGAGLLVLLWRLSARARARRRQRISKACRDLRRRLEQD